MPQVKHKHLKEARAIAIIAWSSGARPVEMLELKGEDIEKDGKFFLIHFKGHKGSNKRVIPLLLEEPLIAEAWTYCSPALPWMYLFPHFRGNHTRHSAQTKVKLKGTYKEAENKPYTTKLECDMITKTYTKDYQIISYKLEFWFKKWFNLPPYFFRHNRISIASERLSLKQLMILKGAKTEASVLPYIQMGLSKEVAAFSKTLIE